MAARFVEIESVESLSSLFDRSYQQTVILFNHDPWRPISARAWGEVEQVNAEFAIVNVARQRTVTSEIARATGVRHESPQVIVLRDGRPTWTASHVAIVAAEVRRAAGLV